MKNRFLLRKSKFILVFGMTAILSIFLFTNCVDVNTSNVNSSTNAEDTMAEEDSGIYAYKMDDNHSTYCIINLEDQCVYLFTNDADDDSCYKMDITSGDAEDSLNAVLATDEITMPINIQFKNKEKTQIVLVMQEAYENELELVDLKEAANVMADKKIIESTSTNREVEKINDVMSEEGQIRHRNRIMGDENRINAVIEDIEYATGETISFEKADFIKESLDLYTDSSKDIKSAYNDPESEFRPFMEALDDYLNNVTKWHGKVMRGKIVSKETAEKIKAGKDPIDMQGPSSWTSDEKIARSYAKDGVTDTNSETGIVFVLEDNKSGASITHLSLYGITEAEVLAPSGVQYVIDHYETVNDDSFDFLYVYVHEQES